MMNEFHNRSMEKQIINPHSPREHARHLQESLGSLKELCRSDIELFDSEPQGRALLETSADVLAGLEKAFRDFLSKEYPGWQEGSELSLQKDSDPWD